MKIILLITITIWLLLPTLSLADVASSQALEWEAPLLAFRNSLTGPVALSIAVLGIVACGFALVWGGEMNDFIRRVLMLVLAISLMLFATGIISSLFGSAETIASERRVDHAPHHRIP